MDKKDPPLSHRVFKPVGHVVISFPSEQDLLAAREALGGIGVSDTAMTTYTADEMVHQAEGDIDRATSVANIGQELNLVKAHLELARLGYHFLVVRARDSDAAARVAEAVRPHNAERAQLYGAFVIEELIDHPDDQPQISESPERGLDAQTPSGRESERATRRPH